MKIKTEDLTGAALDWLVAKASGYAPEYDYAAFGTVFRGWWLTGDGEYKQMPHYSTNWAQAGPIIQREGISTRLNHKQAQLWEAYIWLPTQHDQSEADSNSYTAFGTTPLIAAMRCFC